MAGKPARVFSQKPRQPCPRCYAPMIDGECRSRGCQLARERGEA